MNPAELFQNVLRAILFGFICGIVFTILFMISTYSIVDTGLKATFYEERVMNYLTDHADVSLLKISKENFAQIITRASENERKNDKMGLRIRILDPLTRKVVVLTDSNYNLIYDPSKTFENYFASTSTNPNDVKSNYAGVQTYRLYNDPVDKKLYLLEFQYITN